jgi:hypothetical protein
MTTVEDFKAKVDLYSADLSRWPAAEVKPALAFMKAHPAAQKYFDAALALDAELRAYVPRTAKTEVLEQRILREIKALPPAVQAAGKNNPAKAAGKNIPAKASRAKSGLFGFSPAWIAAPGGGLLAAAVLGFIVGFSPAQKGDLLLDPVQYSQHQIIGDAGAYDGGMF